jgi:hypothetical protein
MPLDATNRQAAKAAALTGKRTSWPASDRNQNENDFETLHQPRTTATASTIVIASAASTREARKAAVSAEPACKLIIVPPGP